LACSGRAVARDDVEEKLMTQRTDPEKTDAATRQVDEDDARAGHAADRMPTADEERIADGLEVDPEVAEAYEAAIERGANVRGEGQIEP
jgi:hypothetical protein